MDAAVNVLVEGSSPPPCARCAELQAQVEDLRQQVRRLQAKLDQSEKDSLHSGNSSKPPSSDPPYLRFKLRRKKSKPGKPGGRKGHPGHHRKLLPPERVDRIVDYLPHACRRCGSSLPAEVRPCDPGPRRHQVAEVPPLTTSAAPSKPSGPAQPHPGSSMGD